MLILDHTAERFPSIDYYFKPKAHSAVALVQVSTVYNTVNDLAKLEETSKHYRRCIEGNMEEILFIYINPHVDVENQFHQYAEKFFNIRTYKTLPKVKFAMTTAIQVYTTYQNLVQK